MAYREGHGKELDLASRLSAWQARMQRFLELDVARIEDYYDSLERDLKQRLARSSPKSSAC